MASSRKMTPRNTPAGGGAAPAALPAPIVPDRPGPVKPKLPPPAPAAKKPGRPGRPKTRRQSHGSAWHWRQTDAWYYTLPGTKRRIPLLDEDGSRIHGQENRDKARLALARVRLAERGELPADPPVADWAVARACSEYLQYCDRGVAGGTISADHRDAAARYLNELCRYCGALPVAQLKKAHVQAWADGQAGWKSPVTVRSVLAIVIAAFNHAEREYGVPNPIKGLRKPAARPRLHSLSAADEGAMLGAADPAFRDFLFAAAHTGLRPFCELARLTAGDVEETPRGMMWRVYSTKTKKARKLPVRPEVAELARRLMAAAPSAGGPLFRTKTGRAWTKVHGVHRFCQLRKALGWDADPVRRRYSCYSCRHTFAHRMLSGHWNGGAGCSVEVLAELIGDTPKVAFDHYGREWGQHYQDPLWTAIGVKAPAGASAPGLEGER